MTPTRWVRIADWPDYSVSDDGRVRRETTRTCARAGRELRACLRNRYLAVDLCRAGTRKTVSVHRLVAAAFLGERPGAEVNHINGVRTDNSVENLEYVTRSENALHAYRTGLASAMGERNGQAKLDADSIREIRREWSSRHDTAILAQRFGVSPSSIRDVLRGRTWTHLSPIDSALTERGV